MTSFTSIGNDGRRRQFTRCRIQHCNRRPQRCSIHEGPPLPRSSRSIHPFYSQLTDFIAPPSNKSPSLYWSPPSRLGKATQTKLVRHKKQIHKRSNHIRCATRKSYTSTSYRSNGCWASTSCSRNNCSTFKTSHFLGPYIDVLPYLR